MEETNVLICGNLKEGYLLKEKVKLCILDTEEEVAQKNAYFKNLKLYNSISQLPSSIKLAYIPKTSLIAANNSCLRQELLAAGISVFDELPKDLNQIKDCLQIANNRKVYYIPELPGLNDDFFIKCVNILHVEFNKNNILYIDGIFSNVSLYYVLKILKEGLRTNQKIQVTNYYSHSVILTLLGYILSVPFCAQIYQVNITKEYNYTEFSDELKIFTRDGCITMDCINRKVSYNSKKLKESISIDDQEFKIKKCNKLNISKIINFDIDLIYYRSRIQEILNDFVFMEEFNKVLFCNKIEIECNEIQSLKSSHYITFKDKSNCRYLSDIDKEIIEIEENYSHIPDDYLLKYKNTIHDYILEELFDFFIENEVFVRKNVVYTDDFIINHSFKNRNTRIIKRWLMKLISGNFIKYENGNYWSVRDSQKDDIEQLFYELRKLWDWKLGSPYSMDYIRENIKKLKELFDGKIDCNTILFPESDIRYATALYKDNIIYRFLNEIIGIQVVNYVNEHFDKKCGKITILELGAGIGATTDNIIKKLKEYNLFQKVNYLYTDISKFFLDIGKEKYKDNSIVRYLKLNIDDLKELESLEDIDIIVAAGVLNNSKNLEEVMKELLKKIKLDGLMLITEPMDEPIEMLVSQVFMMEEPNDVRSDKNSTFLGVNDWLNIIKKYGSFEVSIFPKENHSLSVFGQKLFIIKNER